MGTQGEGPHHARSKRLSWADSLPPGVLSPPLLPTMASGFPCTKASRRPGDPPSVQEPELP